MFLFSLQSMVSPESLGTPKEEVEKLKEEVKMWKASSVNHGNFLKNKDWCILLKPDQTPHIYCSVLVLIPVGTTLVISVFTQTVKNK